MKIYKVGFEAVMAASMKMAALWVIAIHHQGDEVMALMMEAASTFETSVMQPRRQPSSGHTKFNFTRHSSQQCDWLWVGRPR
jgi:hypothetical protein